MHIHHRLGCHHGSHHLKSGEKSQTRNCRVNATVKAKATVFVDLDSVINTSTLQLTCALAAAQQLTWGTSSAATELHEVAPILSNFDIRDVPLGAPEEAVILVKLLQEELLIGEGADV